MNTQDLARRIELSELLNYLTLPELEELDSLLLAPTIESPADWIEANFYIPETHGTLTLAPYQRACLNEALRRDENGLYVYSVIVWSDLKKSAKSTIAAAVADYVATQIEWGSVKIVANDLKQADSRVAFYLRRHLELHPTKQSKINRYLAEYPNHARVEAIPVDPKGEAGGNDDAIIFSELWAANQRAALQMWSEMTLSPTKYGRSFRWVESYAGMTGESPLLENLYDLGVKQGERLDLGIPDLEVYANVSARLFCLWNTQPRLEWQTPEYYAQEAAVLTPQEFQRVHRNQWVSSEDVFVPSEWWTACKTDLPALSPSQSLVIGVDAAVSDDCFAIVAVSREQGDKVAVRYVGVWKPPVNGKLDFDEPEKELRRLCADYNVVQIAYDNFQLHHLMTRLKDLTWVNDFKQGQPRLIADKNLYDLIRERRMMHSGEPVLTEHITNANRKPDEGHLRIVKRAHALKIDACVALSMATFECLRLNL